MTGAAYRLAKECPQCGGQMQLRARRGSVEPSDKFYGCRRYPDCRFTEPYDVAIADLFAAVDQLRRHIDVLELERKIYRAAGGGSPPPSPETPASVIDERLRVLLFEFHPDRNPQGLDANRVAAALNELRTRTKGRR